jgi:glycosyltransferase involved in cell wall biosynthesis
MEPELAAGDRPAAAAPDGRPATVLHVISGLGAGGAEAMLRKLVCSPGRYRHQVVSLADPGVHGAAIRDHGVPVFALDMERPARFLVGIPALARIIRRSAPDIVLGWMNHGILGATLAHGLARSTSPLMWNVRQTIVHGAEKPLTRWIIGLNARLARRPRMIVYNSSAGAAAHEAVGFDPARRRVIPNGFDLARFHPDSERRRETRAALGIAEGEIVVGLVARLHKMKNQEGFFAAARLVLESEPEVRFLLAGLDTDPDNKELLAMMDPAVRRSTLCLGMRNDVPDVTRAIDIACNVSHGEGFANTIGEAMASGVPCIVTDIGDSAQIVGSTGVVCESGSPEAIASAILKLVRGGAELRHRLGQEARRRIEEEFSLSGIVARYELAFDEVRGLAVSTATDSLRRAG